MRKSKIISATILLGGLLGLFFAGGVRAYDVPSIDISKLADSLPSPLSPLTDFINSAKQINLQTLNPQNVWSSINTWFSGTTGISLVQLIKAIGSFLVWMFSLVAQLIGWGLSFIK
jgi:hypothetical protein